MWIIRHFNCCSYVVISENLYDRVADLSDSTGCWGPCYTMSSHAALGVVRAGVAVLKGAESNNLGKKQRAILITQTQALVYELIA